MGFQLKKTKTEWKLTWPFSSRFGISKVHGSLPLGFDKSPSPTSTIPELGMTTIELTNRSCPQN